MSKKSLNLKSTLKSDERLAFLLEECENGAGFGHLSASQYEEFWKIVKKFLTDNIGKAEESNHAIVKDCLILIHRAVQADEVTAGNCLIFVTVLKIINEQASELADVEGRNIVCKINEQWLANEELPQIRGMEVFTLRHLLCLCLIEKPLVVDLKRLGAFRKYVTAEMLEATSLGFRPLLCKLIQHPIVIGAEVAQKFIAYVASRSNALMQDIHKSIALELSTCKKKTAANYGKTYILAWCDADAEMKPNVERCMQSLMEEFMRQRRTGLELPKRYANLLQTIDTWNVEVRKKNNNAFISAIADCYRPILWKYLQSGYNSQRCSAVDLFFKAFPLQKPDDPEADQELFDMQYSSILDALKDDCHIVRIIAVREICNILPVYWTQFSAKQIQEIMTILTKIEAVDRSSPEVRRMVWRGFLSFLSSKPAYDYLKQILPAMKDHVHEINQRCRIAFLLLLIAIRDKKDPDFKFTSIVSMTTLLNRLAVEKLAVGRYIVRLLLPTFYSSGMELREWIKRFVQLIKAFPHSYRNFFMFSNKVLPFEEAHSIMCDLLSYMGGYVREKLAETDEDSSENDSRLSNSPSLASAVRGRRNVKSSSDSDSSTVSTPAPQNCAFEDPDVVTGLFDIVTILWVLCDVHLNKPGQEARRRQLLDIYTKFAQPFICYYKDSMLFNSIITMSGNVPVSILTANSITLPGYCMKMLKSMEMSENNLDAACNQSMLIALIKWGRGSVVLEQVSLWIEAAFESLHSTSMERTKRVKIHETIQPNSVVAVYILDTVIKTEHMKTVILQKHYDQLLELWKFIGGIKELIYRRFLRGQPYNEPLLSDEFLTKCFIRYVKLIPLLQPSEKPKKETDLSDEDDAEEIDDENMDKFNAAAELFAIIAWVQDDLFPLLQAEDCPNLELLATFINTVLNVSDNMITIRMVDVAGFSQVGKLVISLLTLEHNLHFIRAASRVTTALNFSAKILIDERDQLCIWSTVMPSLLSHILNALVSRPHTIETLEHFKQDFVHVKTNIGKVLSAYEDNFKLFVQTKERVGQMKLIMQKMLQAIRVVLGREVPRADLSVPVYASVTQLHPCASIVLGSVYNKKFWTPLFLLVVKENMGRSVKTLLIDILILHLFSKIEGNKYQGSIESVWKDAMSRLNDFKVRRDSGAVKSLGITLCQVENQEANKDEEDVEMGEEDPTCPTQPTCSTQDRFTGISGTTSRGLSEQLTGLTIPSCQNTEDRLSGLNALSQDQLTGASALPSSQGIVERLTGTSAPSCSQETRLTASGAPVSGLATINTDTQPQSIGASIEPVSPRAVDIRHIPEDELIDDFIGCGFELLNTVKELMKLPAASTSQVPEQSPKQSVSL